MPGKICPSAKTVKIGLLLKNRILEIFLLYSRERQLRVTWGEQCRAFVGAQKTNKLGGCKKEASALQSDNYTQA